MNEKTPADLSVDDILATIRAEVERRAGLETDKKADCPASHREAGEKTDTSLSASRPRGSVSKKVPYALSDFTGFHDEQFVLNAYQRVLKRKPDESGFAYYLDGLRTGKLTKPDILGRLRFSAEGRLNKTGIKGLLLPFAIDNLCRIPVLGYLIRIVSSLAALPRRVRAFQVLENAFHAYQYDSLVERRNINNRFTVLEYDIQERLNADIQERLSALEGSFQERLSALESNFQERVSKLDQAVQEKTAELKFSLSEIDKNKPNLNQIHLLSLQIMEQKQYLLTQQAEFAQLLKAATRCLPEPIPRNQLETLVARGDHLLDALYVSFEDHFRGSREEIKKRQRVYLPAITDAHAGTAEAPVLDLGCGRGEWLEVLRGQDLQAAGADTNQIMIQQCRSMGLTVYEKDALEMLRGVPPDSLGAVTGFHVIEHLPFRQLIALLDETLRVLRPGGGVIFETPNPGNIMVGSYNFYFDPTHRNPLPSKLVMFLLESRGFVRISEHGIAHHPEKGPVLTPLRYAFDDLNQIVSEPHDYAVMGYKMSSCERALLADLDGPKP